MTGLLIHIPAVYQSITLILYSHDGILREQNTEKCWWEMLSHNIWRDNYSSLRQFWIREAVLRPNSWMSIRSTKGSGDGEQIQESIHWHGNYENLAMLVMDCWKWRTQRTRRVPFASLEVLSSTMNSSLARLIRYAWAGKGSSLLLWHCWRRVGMSNR